MEVKDIKKHIEDEKPKEWKEFENRIKNDVTKYELSILKSVFSSGYITGARVFVETLHNNKFVLISDKDYRSKA